MSGTSTEARLSALFSSTSHSGDDDLDSKLIEQPSTPGAEVAGPSADIRAAVRFCRDMIFKPGSAEKTKSSEALSCTESSSASGPGSMSKCEGHSERPNRTKTDNLCHPIGYKKEKDARTGRRQRKNPIHTLKVHLSTFSHQTTRLRLISLNKASSQTM